LIRFKEEWNAKKYPLYHFTFPEGKSMSSGNSGLVKYLKIVNNLLPLKLLKLEGRLIYPHLG